MENVVSENEKIEKLQTLSDIYVNENTRIKYEYRVLHDKYCELENNYNTTKEEIDRLQASNTELQKKLQQINDRKLKTKIVKIIKNSIFYKGLRKAKNMIKKG